jgi:hypothetical protein
MEVGGAEVQEMEALEEGHTEDGISGEQTTTQLQQSLAEQLAKEIMVVKQEAVTVGLHQEAADTLKKVGLHTMEALTGGGTVGTE